MISDESIRLAFESLLSTSKEQREESLSFMRKLENEDPNKYVSFVVTFMKCSEDNTVFYSFIVVCF
jgi:hypothetical protein